MADSTKTFTSPSSPPKEAKSGMLLNYLKDPVFGSPEYDIPQAPSLDTVVTKEEFEIFSANSEGIEFSASAETTVENDQNSAFEKFINISIPISKPDVGGTAVKAAQVTGETVSLFGEAGLEIAKIITGLEKAPKVEKKTPEDQEKEIANRQNTSVVQRVVNETGQISQMRDQKDNQRIAGDEAASLSEETQRSILHLQKKEKLSKKDMVDLRNALIEQEKQRKMQKPSPFNKGGKGTLSSQRANQNEAPEGGGALATVTRGPQ